MQEQLKPLSTGTDGALHWARSTPTVSIGAPYENRTRVSALRGRRPGPLDEGSAGSRVERGLL